MEYGNLFHDKVAFSRETLDRRMQDFGFKNLGRMELFLWDLELFLQIQARLGQRVVLKGGAATQFYLPKDFQRTRVDIDMLFAGTEEEIDETLITIEEKLGDGKGLFRFRKHKPANPKTTLPLFTYYTEIPSVLTMTERNVKESGTQSQELKIEFITQSAKQEFSIVTGEEIFAVHSVHNYQVLPLNSLFADKLTTLGCNTIGVQNDRLDEQVKQFYDILMLTRYCFEKMDPTLIWGKYKERAREEWHERAHSSGEWKLLNNKEFSLKTIAEDVRLQMQRYEQVDNGEDKELKKAINDFKSLYLNNKVSYTPADVACGAKLVRLMYELLCAESEWPKISDILRIEKKLNFSELSGVEKGQKIRQVREVMIDKYGESSLISSKILKGKHPIRIFWAVVTLENLDDIKTMIDYTIC